MAETWTLVSLTNTEWTSLTDGAADVVLQTVTTRDIAVKSADSQPEISDEAYMVLRYPQLPGFPRSFQKQLWARSLSAETNAVRVLAQS